MAHIKRYLKAARPFSFTASATSALFGSAAAYYHFSHLETFHFNILSCILVTVGCISIHIVSNLLNTYYDEQSGLDRVPEASGADNAIVKGLLTAKQVKRAALFFFILASIIGMYFVWICGTAIIVLILFGTFSAWAYTAPPFKLKYRGLGDIQVILSFGILMIAGAYTTQGYHFATTDNYVRIVMMSLPLSFLVDAILHANNHRDRDIDIRYSAKTLSTKVSERSSINFYMLLLYGAVFITILLVIANILPTWEILPSVVVLPLMFVAIRKLSNRGAYTAEKYNVITADTAKIHLIYGLISTAILIFSA